MRLYNTLTKQVEEIEPQSPPRVGVYTCGPTAYDYPHIGNWFTFIRYDLLVRTLKASGFEPNWVLNITDVGHLVSDADEGEDKLEKGARREGKSAWEIANFYTDYFMKGLKRLNFTQPSHLPRATEHINEQIDLIKKLEEKGYTYQIDDGVYYDTSKFPRYADFARLDLDEQQPGARVDHNPQKRNPSDFALWKFSPKDHQRDMEWDSPWGKGFPGWHIECSAIIHKYFGDTVDIHSGGIDHVPVHHTNEIAQSEAVTDRPLAKYWMHTNHILIDDEKISKSKNNGITLEGIESRGIELEAFRLHALESHYRSQSKFSWESLEAAQNRLKHWREAAALRWQSRPPAIDNEESYEAGLAKAEDDIPDIIGDDLDTPALLARIDDVFSVAIARTLRQSEVEIFTRFLKLIDQLLGLDLFNSEDITESQRVLLHEREAARKNNDWAKSDKLRDDLAAQGIGLRDRPNGAIWYRI